jgi:hypothetical protein
MWRFKLFSWVVTTALAGLLLACSIPAAENRDGVPVEAGTFFIEKSDVSMTDQTQHESISLATSKSFTFKICVKDNSLSKEIINHKFVVSGGESEQELTSDATGCIRWLERISYNHLAPAKWVEALRTVKASGIHQGQRTAKFALNPWEDQAISLQDKKLNQLIPAAQFKETLNAATEKGLWLDDVRLTISEKVPGSVLGIEMRGQASFSVTKADGKNIQEPISRGNFLVEFSLINTMTQDKKEIRTLLGKTEAVPAQVVGGSLILPQELQMNLKSLCTYGQLLMAIRLEPQTKDLKLAPFEGVYTNIGECDQLKGTFLARLKTPLSLQKEGARNVSEFLGLSVSGGGPTSNTTSPTIKATQAGTSRVIVKDPLTFTNVGFSGPNAFQREKTFSVTACFQGAIDYKALRGHRFHVKKVNGQTQDIDSLDSGCITWDDSVSFQYLDQECWIQKSFQISNDLLKMNETMMLDINPWDESFTSVRDGRTTKGQKALQCASDKPSKIILNYFDFDTRDLSYPIDQHLGIKVQKEGILRLMARLVRPSPKSPIGVEESFLPPGKYKLRWAIVDSKVKIKELDKASGFIYQAQEKEVTLEAGGLISESLVFESGNIRSLGNLNHIFFELEPLQSMSKVARETYQGSVLLSDRKEPGNLEPMGYSKESLVLKLMAQFKDDQIRHEKLQTQMSGKEALARNTNVILTNLDQVSGNSALLHAVNAPPSPDSILNRFKAIPALTPQQLRTWLENGQTTGDLSDHLCLFWFYELLGQEVARPDDRLKSYQSCSTQMRKAANSFLNVEFRYLVGKITKLEDLPMQVEDKVVGNAFTMSYAKDYTKTKSMDINGGINTGKMLGKIIETLSPISFGGGGRLQWAWSEKEGAANSTSVQSATSLLMEKLKFKLRAEEYEKCALVQFNPAAIPTWVQEKIKASPKPEETQQKMMRGLLLCQGEVQKRPITFQESYTIINQKIYNTQAVNPHSDLGRPFFVVVRGEKDYRTLLQLIAGEANMPKSAGFDFNSHQDLQRTFLPAFSHSTALTYPGQFISDR